jgi:hypothetical protein
VDHWSDRNHDNLIWKRKISLENCYLPDASDTVTCSLQTNPVCGDAGARWCNTVREDTDFIDGPDKVNSSSPVLNSLL